MKTLQNIINSLFQDWKTQYINSAIDLSDVERRLKQVELIEIRDAKIRMVTIRL